MTMKTFAGAALLLAALASGGCTTSQAKYETGQVALKTNPEIRRKIEADCIKDIDKKPAVERANVAAMIDVPVSRVSSAFCGRMIRAVANNRISYADIQNAKRKGDYVKFIRVLRGR